MRRCARQAARDDEVRAGLGDELRSSGLIEAELQLQILLHENHLFPFDNV